VLSSHSASARVKTVIALRGSLCKGAVLIAASSALCVSACGRSESDFDRGNRLFSEREYHSAIAAYEAAARAKPGDTRIPRQLGLAYSVIGERRTAIKYLETAERTAPADTTAHLALAGLYLSDARADDAIREANTILERRPAHIAALSVLGAAYLAKNQPDSAIAAFQTITDVSPRDPSAHYLIGVSLMSENQAAQAAQQFEYALSITPSYVEPLSKLVQMDLASDQPDAAIDRIKKQVVVAGYSPQLHEMLGVTYIARGKNDLAEGTLLELIRRSPGYVDPYYRLGDLYRSEGQYDKALTIVARGLGAEPNNVSLLLMRGLANEGKGNLGGARWSYEQALNVDSHFSLAAARLAIVLAESGKALDSAARFILAARESNPASPEIADAFGWVFFQRGEYVSALAALKEAAVKLPNDPGVAYHVGMAYAKSGDLPSARRELQRAVDAASAFPQKDDAKKALAALK
jgi:cellulose synthase operon protein C